ncbi:MAG: lysophospholipid acyltransferase family protein [Aliihoeflea sp.]
MGKKTISNADTIAARATQRRRPLKAAWQRLRGPLAETPAAKNALAAGIVALMRAIKATNPLASGSDDPLAVIGPKEPVILALWHGQHLLAPAYLPRELRFTALFSKSRDAELNALVAERLGFGIVRGSGGREGHDIGKGGARALILLKRVLDAGRNVAMIADIPHGTPRDAGLGIVTLARISGRPIVPAALATSRRKVLEKSWDKTAINLPFGRAAIVIGDAITVPASADDAAMEDARRAVTAGLDRVTAKAYGLVGAAA